jgi:uncharacterized protein involved in exopolysaccharide biosynthesis
MGLAFLIPPRFEATAQLMPPEGQPATGLAALSALAGSTGALGGLAGEMLAGKNSGALFVGILASRTVADRLIEQFDLRHLYHAVAIEDARNALAAHSRVVEDHKSGIIAITVTDRDPRRAAAIAQAYVEQLNHLVEQVSTSSARRERIFLEERLRAVKQDLDAAAEKFSTFASANTAIDIPAQSKALLEAAATLEGQLIAAEAELHGLETVYTDQNVRVRALRARVTELKNQLGKMRGQAGNLAGSETSEALPYPPIRQLPILGVTYADLYRKTKIQETVYELLTQQYELAKVEEAKEIPSVKVLDAAVVPTKKSFPPRGLFTMAGAAISLAAACAWIFIRQSWQQIDPQDPEKVLAQEIAATLRADALRLFPTAAFARLQRRLQAVPPRPAPIASHGDAAESPNAANLAQPAHNGLG